MSSTIDLDFQDYAPTKGGDTNSLNQQQQQQQQQYQPNVQILIPQQSPSSGSATGKEASSGASSGSKSVLNLLQSLRSSQIPSTSGGLSEEALQQLIWLSNKQRNKQQRESKISGSNWGLGLLAQYFDVTTNDVIQRIIWSAIPIRKEGLDLDEFQDSDLIEPLTSELLLNNSQSDESNNNGANSRLSAEFGARKKRLSYMERFIQSRPDFYGPFWVSTTLIFSIGIISNIVSHNKFQSRIEDIIHIKESFVNTNGTQDRPVAIESLLLNEANEWHYSMSGLNTAASLITFYATLWPSLLWFLFWLRGSAKYYTLTETICAYGYSLSIFIPMSALLIVQATAFRYLILSIAATLSGSVLVLSFLPMVSGNKSVSGGSHFIVLIMVFACQFGLAYILHRIMLQ